MTQPAELPAPEELVERLSAAMVGAFDLFAIYIGDQLGYYQALGEASATSVQLAERTGTAERYAREWLEQQAVTGILTVDDPGKPAQDRVFSLPANYRDIFLNPTSPMAIAPAAQIFVGAITPLPAVLDAFRSGGGVPYADYGADLACGQGSINRPMLANRLAQEYIPAMPDIHAQLMSDTQVRVADIGMGLGWSSIALAKSFPNILVDGFDLDERSVQLAAANAQAEGVSNRVTFHARNAGDVDFAGKYDFALAVECVHDMSNPVAVLDAMRRLVGPGGTVLVVDEKAEDAFNPMGSESERSLYGWSILHCLPVGMVDQPSAGTGAVMRPETLRAYAAQAGFQQVETLPVDNDSFHFYRLTA
jgi:2-polyprenyl-3-methyl-5-hydroxy-6-metoxy-1,4-benzoquinol methylase